MEAAKCQLLTFPANCNYWKRSRDVGGNLHDRGLGWGGAVCWIPADELLYASLLARRPDTTCGESPREAPLRPWEPLGVQWEALGFAATDSGPGMGHFTCFALKKQVSRKGALRGGKGGVRDEVLLARVCACPSTGRCEDGKRSHVAGFPLSSPGAPRPRGQCSRVARSTPAREPWVGG